MNCDYSCRVSVSALDAVQKLLKYYFYFISIAKAKDGQVNISKVMPVSQISGEENSNS